MTFEQFDGEDDEYYVGEGGESERHGHEMVAGGLNPISEDVQEDSITPNINKELQ